ncbi:MAG: 30S ribosomal protein S3 [Patescibacteria group bacterium]
MTHKVNPKIFRIGTTQEWDSNWFSSKKYKENLEEDWKIRQILAKEFSKGVVEKINIKRLGERINIIIKTARPGLIIGRGGEGVEALLKKMAKKLNKKDIKLDIEEIRDPSTSASLLAQQIAVDFERRVPYKRAVKRTIERVFRSGKVGGIKIRVKGRLDGVEIGRNELFKEGKLPLNTIRADIDYSEARAECTYGIVGIKVWLYKGEKA